MRRIVLAGLAALAGGCSLAPAYHAPTPNLPAHYPAPDLGSDLAPESSPDTSPEPGAAPTSASETPAPQIGWRAYFGDERLQALIGAALAHNRDLEVATARLAQARARYRIEDADRLPAVGAGAGATRSRTPLNLAGLGDELGEAVPELPDAVTTDQYSVQVAVSAFELDFWGRVRNMSEASRRQYLATVEARRAFRLSLIGEVAGAYFAIRSGEESVALGERILAGRREALALARLRAEAGVIPSMDLDQAELLTTQAQTDLAETRRMLEQRRNQLQVLVGAPMGGALPQGRPLDDPAQVLGLAPGLPSDLLLARPDIRQAEEGLRGADASIGAARAAFFPSLSLTGALGIASPELAALFDGDAARWSISGAVNLPIFDNGGRRARLAEAEARQDELVATYQKTVQTAFREVSDALVARQRYSQQIEAQRRTVAAQQRLAQTARLRYDAGVAAFTPVLEAERNLFSAEQQLARLRAARLQAEASLYVALGGGDAAEGG